MKKHMTHKDLASYVADTMNRHDRARYEEHIGECRRCRDMHRKMLSAVAPRYRSLEASEKTGERIARSWRDINAAAPAGGTAGFRALARQRPWASIASASAAAAAIAVIVVSVIWQSPGSASLTVKSADGGIAVNGLPVKAGDAVYESGRFLVRENSMLQLVHDDAITISLVNRCDASLPRLSRDSRSRLHLVAVLEEGILVSDARGGKRIAYEYRTPGARIEPLGTEFLLQAHGGATLIIMKSGAARVTDIRTGKSDIVHSGRKYIAADVRADLPATGEDLEIFGDLNGLRGGDYNRLLLPAMLAFRVHSADAARDAGSSGSGETGIMHGEKSNSSGDGRNDLEERRRAREDRNREIMRQRMTDKKIQMNEIRRSSRTDAAPRMRMGR